MSAQPQTRKLALTRLSCTQFRCYENLRLDLDGRPVVLTGPNGAGKTNFLEAVSYLAPGRGLRAASLPDILRIGAPDGAAWAVAATIDTPEGPVDLGTGRDSAQETERRAVRINGQTVRSQALLGDHVSMVWLTPQMDRLFLEGASSRRRFLDRLAGSFDAAHAGRLSRYDHALRERARLLGDGVAEPAWLEGLELVMAETGVALAAARRDYVARLNAACAAGGGVFPQASVAVSGAAEDALEHMPALAVEDKARRNLRAARVTDAAAGGAGWGPHRSDMLVRHATRDMAAEMCSTGEQKALLVSIMLAHSRLVAAERGHAPILLLDEIAAHLDSTRREALFGEILTLGGQAFLTGTEPVFFEGLKGHAAFHTVQNGQISTY